ncbi:hypothetical protein RJJ65_37340 [Rhizobium hidalgonense]|uniref:Uncharacterized protein n=1 Tax=Rhizobium hidalgonense TaxID=1538159 RepID=A0AAJ2GYK6_9HYPH|nr:hypothetical protein [Rhizobium hidalgonense]MDR9778205.1 hypothetical protein [Rhizobium hidalgonense]
MMNIPVLLLPVLAFVLAVIVGRLVTIVMDQFREDGAALEKGLSDAATSNQTAV